MLDNFDPQEKKVILIFIAVLLLGLVYVGTHDLQFGQPQQPYGTPLPEEEASSSGIYL
ncbi:MAG: hypothetical protein MK515_00785 [SAR324 cluster bacterium]|jgi:hypothetical protein|nr:hypothetical protein [SAR324 cluster bacterium]MCH2264985.1 hypothetical protein [SAR324 cluster bacterium]